MQEKIFKENYAGIFDRVKAIVTDSFVIVIFMAIASSVLSSFQNVPDWIRIITFLFIFLLYDPLFTVCFGGTIGHMIVGLRVKREKDEMKNISFPLAVMRYIIKALLGIVSLFTVSNSEKGRAIHDYLAGSVVVYAKRDKTYKLPTM